MQDINYAEKIFNIRSSIDIPRRWLGTPIETFIMAQNFGYPIRHEHTPQLLLVTCIEFRYSPVLPSEFAYVVRSPGSRLIGNEFSAGYAIAKGVRNIALVAHDDCGMTKVAEHANGIVKALVEQGWTQANAQNFVEQEGKRFAISDELGALQSEYHRLKKLFHNIHVAPLFFCLKEQKLNIPLWYHQMLSKQP